ncbi:MAG: hypothetical protein IT222_12170 [Crocinitomix sp.]|nr:hypothetical protein [Crocinitomix sp.]
MNIMPPKKIVLIVTNGKDYSIKAVSEWLLFYCQKLSFQLVIFDTSKDKLRIIRGEISTKSNLKFGFSNQPIEFELKDIHAVLFRQARLEIDQHTGLSSNRGQPTNVTARIYNYLMAYELTLRWFLLNCLGELNIIGYDSGSVINKLEVLKIANKVGLKNPETMLVSKKTDLIEFLREHNELIIKTLGIGLAFYDQETNMQYTQLTNVINQRTLTDIPDEFNLSLIQKRIEKEFEIRVFYLDETCYSWALLSQTRPNSTIDYRNYDWDNPMRVVSFDLPENETRKIIKLMKKLRLRTGSLDLIYSKTGEYIFLEVNPAGQYGYNSNCSNYNLDKHIASALIEKHERKKHRIFHS